MGCTQSVGVEDIPPGSAIDPVEAAAYHDAEAARRKHGDDSGGDEDSEPGFVGRKVTLAMRTYEAEQKMAEYEEEEAERRRVAEAERLLRNKYLISLGVDPAHLANYGLDPDDDNLSGDGGLAGEKATAVTSADGRSSTASRTREYCTPARRVRIVDWLDNAIREAARAEARSGGGDAESSIAGSGSCSRGSDPRQPATVRGYRLDMPHFSPVAEPSRDGSPARRESMTPMTLSTPSQMTPRGFGMSISAGEDLAGDSPKLPLSLRPSGSLAATPTHRPTAPATGAPAAMLAAPPASEPLLSPELPPLRAATPEPGKGTSDTSPDAHPFSILDAAGDTPA